MTDELFGPRLGGSGGRTSAPEDLTPAQWVKLREWAEARVPWVSRGAFGSITTLEDYVETVLDWGRSNNKRKADWLATVRNWIRTDEFARIARHPDPDARAALRFPGPWATAYDARVAAITKAQAADPGEIFRPAGGTVHDLVPRIRR